MDDESEHHRAVYHGPGPRIPPPRTSAESTQTVTFWDPPEVMRWVVMWVMDAALLLLSVGLVVYLTVTHDGGHRGGGTQPSHSSPASGGMTN